MIQFTIIDIIDILLVSFLIYFFLHFFKGTKAILTLTGVFILFALWIAGSIFDLKTLKFIVAGLGNIWLIIFVILFQNEIRKALLSLGSKGFSRFIFAEEREKLAKEISDAAKILSDKRIGALIAIERNDVLDQYIERGIKMEASVDANLIVSIFSPYSPLHDGGIIIRGTSIVGAKSIFPLSKNPNLGPSFGTRHLAAVGITEETDCMCVVVSEETGSISLCSGGNIERNIEPEKLKTKIINKLQKGG
uniref:Diadenylate cyclase n=1 Tax=candidate division WOR-3 bacterium TaxID=2052148 RepID=A0A7C4U7M2_UNCW3